MPASVCASAPCESLVPVSTAPPRHKRKRPKGKALVEATAISCMWDLEDHPGTYLPTPEEIGAATAEIRSGWSEEEHRLRVGLTPDDSRYLTKIRAQGLLRRKRWTAPVVSLPKGMVHS